MTALPIALGYFPIAFSFGVAATRADHHPPAVLGVALERRFDERLGLAGVAPHQREVFLGEPLRLQLPPERELMELYGVGRPAIREALQAMERSGIVEIASIQHCID